MCLTIPKKVVSIDGDEATVEDPAGNRQKVKKIIDLVVGDFVLAQQGIALEKMESHEASEILEMIKKGADL